MSSTLSIADTCLSVTVHQPAQLQQRFVGGQEVEQGLPPCAAVDIFKVDDYKDCPPNWMPGSAEVTSGFVGLKPERGIWFDFNQMFGHTHHVAVIPSMQGLNAITGQPSEGIGLEQYKLECPVHKQPFGSERFCSACNFKWPAQNYLATTGAPQGLMWLDGFRAKDGTVCQFVATLDEARGIAKQLLRPEKLVYAFGFAVYLSKEEKPKPVYRDRYRATSFGADSYGGLIGSKGMYGAEKMCMSAEPDYDEGATLESFSEPEVLTRSAGPVMRSMRATSAAPMKKIEIAAGAKIKQSVYPDPQELSFWQDKPFGVIVVSYADHEFVREIVSAGAVDRTAGGMGFMQGLNTGSVNNPFKQ